MSAKKKVQICNVCEKPIAPEEKRVRCGPGIAHVKCKKWKRSLKKTDDAAASIGVSSSVFRRVVKTLGTRPDLTYQAHEKDCPLWSQRTIKRIEASAEMKKTNARKLARRPPATIDLLAAVFVVNRSAKRQREAASKHYTGRHYGFARHAKEKKELLYSLKDRGIAAAYVAGSLQYLGKHGGLAIYRGEGYCFHSTLEPVGAATAEDTAATETRIFVEAKPRGATEPRLTDAVETLQSLQEPSLDIFKRIGAPRLPRPRRFRERDFNNEEEYFDEDEPD